MKMGNSAAGGNTSDTNAGKMQVTSTAPGQKMVARVLRSRMSGRSQFDGVVAGDSNPTNPGFKSSAGVSGGYTGSEDPRSNMDYSGKVKTAFRPGPKNKAI